MGTIHFPLTTRLSYSPWKSIGKSRDWFRLYGLARVKMFAGRLNWRLWLYSMARAAFERPCRNRFPVPDRLAKHPAPTESRSDRKLFSHRVSRRFTGISMSAIWLYWFLLRWRIIFEKYGKQGCRGIFRTDVVVALLRNAFEMWGTWMVLKNRRDIIAEVDGCTGYVDRPFFVGILFFITKGEGFLGIFWIDATPALLCFARQTMIFDRRISNWWTYRIDDACNNVITLNLLLLGNYLRARESMQWVGLLWNDF